MNENTPLGDLAQEPDLSLGQRRLSDGVASMTSSKPFCEFLARCFSTERVRLYDLRGESVEQLSERLTEHGLVKMPASDVGVALGLLGTKGAVAIPQYEAVASGLADVTQLVTVARVIPDGSTSAFKAADTLIHQDGYQFPSPYLGIEIAGGGFMPDVEVLSFPTVIERRALVFVDLFAACRAMVRDHGVGLLELLALPIFNIDPKYRVEDPRLEAEPDFSVIFRDELGFRFRVGGSVQTADPQAAFALSMFRTFAQSTVLVELLESGTAFVIDQRRVAHSGIRIPGVDGLTELHRTLLRFDRSGSAS